MTLKERLGFKNSDRVLTAWAEHCSGPGWQNNIIWVLVQDEYGELELSAIQPKDQTYDMGILFNISVVVSKELKDIVNMVINNDLLSRKDS